MTNIIRVLITSILLSTLANNFAYSAPTNLNSFSRKSCKENEIIPGKGLRLGWISIETSKSHTTTLAKCSNGKTLNFSKDLVPNPEEPNTDYVEKIICDMGILIQGYDIGTHGRQYYNLENCESMLDGFEDQEYISLDRKFIALKNDSYMEEGGEYLPSQIKVFDCSAETCKNIFEETHEDMKFTSVKWTKNNVLEFNLETHPNPEYEAPILAEKKKIKKQKCSFDVKDPAKKSTCK